MKRILPVLLIILFSSTVYALDFKKEIAKCTSIEGDLERLICFDKIADAAGVSKKKTQSVKKTGNWMIEVNKNPIDDTKTVIGILEAKDGRSKWGKPVALILRCKSKDTELYINWGSYLGDDSPEVLVRIDSEEARSDRWSSSNDHTATF